MRTLFFAPRLRDHFTSKIPNSMKLRKCSMNGWNTSLLRCGFSIKVTTDRHIANAHRSDPRVDNKFPVCTNGKLKFPHGFSRVRWCWEEDIKIQLLQGSAKVANPPSTTRRICRMPHSNPITVARLCKAMSFSMSTPCLGRRARVAKPANSEAN